LVVALEKVGAKRVRLGRRGGMGQFATPFRKELPTLKPFEH